MYPKVAVIGAGLSGLTTAYRLHKAGYPVTLFEARNRSGGRVFSVKMEGGGIDELGGKDLSDGENATSILSLGRELGLSTERAPADQVTVDVIVLTLPIPVLLKVSAESVIPENQFKLMKQTQYSTITKLLIPVKVPEKMGGIGTSDYGISWITGKKMFSRSIMEVSTERGHPMLSCRHSSTEISPL